LNALEVAYTGEMPSSAATGTYKFRDIPAPDRESDVLRVAVGLVRDRLPASWTIESDLAPTGGLDSGVDAVVRVQAPDGQVAVLLVQAKRLLSTREVPIVLESMRRAASGWGDDTEVVSVLAARYLAPATRERIAAGGAAYVDATGNMRIAADRPGLFLADRGADRDPWRGPGRPRDTLQGPPAARVVRALIDFAPPYSVPELAKRAGSSTGATYRVVDFLEDEGLLERQRYGPIGDVRWRRLLERWSEDYGFARSNTVQTFLEPRGLTALTKRIAAAEDLDYVVTGSLAAERFATYAPARLAMLYVRDLPGVSAALGLRPTETGANVALATGRYDIVFDRADIVDGLRVATASQVAVDMLTGPGRNPSEATALLDWMESNEPAWRL
jgi:hypothetical protein